jgi:hypothetical protein
MATDPVKRHEACPTCGSTDRSTRLNLVPVESRQYVPGDPDYCRDAFYYAPVPAATVSGPRCPNCGSGACGVFLNGCGVGGQSHQWHFVSEVSAQNGEGPSEGVPIWMDRLLIGFFDLCFGRPHGISRIQAAEWNVKAEKLIREHVPAVAFAATQAVPSAEGKK